MKRFSVEMPYNWYAEVEVDDDSITGVWLRAYVVERMHRIVSNNRFEFENLNYSFEIKPGIRITHVDYYNIGVHDFEIIEL